eukprot:1138534-Pelagomonas_calceolata.AAC.9
MECGRGLIAPAFLLQHLGLPDLPCSTSSRMLIFAHLWAVQLVVPTLLLKHLGVIDAAGMEHGIQRGSSRENFYTFLPYAITGAYATEVLRKGPGWKSNGEQATAASCTQGYAAGDLVSQQRPTQLPHALLTACTAIANKHGL